MNRSMGTLTSMSLPTTPAATTITANLLRPTQQPKTTIRPSKSAPQSSTRSVPTRRHSAKRKKPFRSFWEQQWHCRQQSRPQPQQPPNHEARVAALRLILATFNPVYFAREFLHFEPEPAQAQVLAQSVHHKRIALNCNRQWGKSTVAAILAVHRLVTHEGTTVLIIAPSGRQSGETLLKVGRFLGILGTSVRGDGVNGHSIVLPNGSRIVSLPGVDGTSRGFSSVSMLIVDEASRVPDEVYLAVRPGLAVSRGDLI